MTTFRRILAAPIEIIVLVLFLATAAAGYLALKVSGDDQ